MISQFLRWLARHEIEAMRIDAESWVSARILEAYHIGRAEGLCQGRQAVVDSLSRAVDEKRDIFPEVTAEDICRVTKGVLH